MKGGSHVLRYFSDPALGFGHCGSAEKSTTKVAKQPQLSEGEGAGAKAPAHPGYAQPEFCSCPDDYSVGWPPDDACLSGVRYLVDSQPAV